MDLSALPTAGALARGPHVPRWRPGLGGVRHGEVFASGREASGAAAALALMLDGLHAEEADAERSLLWVQDAASLRLTGRPYRPGLPPALRRRGQMDLHYDVRAVFCARHRSDCARTQRRWRIS